MKDYFWLIAIGVVILIIIIISSVLSRDDNNIRYSNRKRRMNEYDKKEQEQFGKAGENYVASMLESIAAEHKAYVFNDYTFKDDKGYSTNIDHILVCQGGVFIIETKSNKGIIYGNDLEETWYAQKEEWQDDKEFRNPIKQNQGHINHLRRMFKNNPPKMISMIIFPAADSLSRVDSDYVYNTRDAKRFILNKIIEEKYSSQFVDRIAKQLKDIIDEYGITTEEHKDNINNRFN